ncbi:21904_t:CDS:1 [Dentiscutata erythropus]|uniref:21904_t:CDS:1 n=1 Tax=Dentiscutata erythropus TaxID=1348616 RepID=A0A9N9K0H7_9GLOM|nr:21904_t:CDS:1 [Dentiscutata erythropus]
MKIPLPLSKNLHTIVKSLNTYKLVVRNEYKDNLQANNQKISNQVHEQQEFITITNINKQHLMNENNQDKDN